MIEHTLNIGDTIAFRSPVVFTCFGLGSCIGLFIQDRVNGITGGAHIFMPEGEPGPCGKSGYNTQEAMATLLERFQKLGSELTGLRAKITGGANLFMSVNSIGERNILSVITELTKHKIFLAAADVGGSESRTAKFNGPSGALMVRKSQRSSYKIF